MNFDQPTAKHALKMSLAFGAMLALAACAQNPQGAGAAAGAGLAAAVPGSPQDFATNVGDRVFFESDSSELSSAGVATLDKQAIWLARYPRYAVRIEGHADERGTREYNFALGARRAETVKTYLAAKGVPASRLEQNPITLHHILRR